MNALILFGFGEFMAAIASIGLFVLVISGIFFTKEMNVKRKLRNADGKRIGEVRDGECVKIKGSIVLSGKVLQAPFSGRKCAYFHVMVQHPGRHGPNTIIEEELAGDVVLRNGIHYAIVDTGLIKSYIVTDKKYSSNLKRKPAPHLETFLNEHGYSTKGFWQWNHEYTFFEGILEKREVIAVFGKAQWRAAAEFGIDVPTDTVLHISSAEGNPVYLSDSPVAIV
jgi:hypothetical protein